MLIHDCIPCQHGDHDACMGVVEKPPPGVIGGWICGCKGECRERDVAKPTVEGWVLAKMEARAAAAEARVVELEGRLREAAGAADAHGLQSLADYCLTEPTTDQKPCPFCDYAGPSIMSDAGDVIVIAPIAPVVPGHELVIPRMHVENFTSAPSITARVMEVAAHEAKRWGTDVNLITSKGEAATQTVKHMHVHLIPRRKGDCLKLPWSDREGGK